MFYKDNITIGGFDCNEFLKFIISSIPNDLIKEYVCNVKYDNKNCHIEINFVNYQNSPFTGDINLLTILYKQIELFEKNSMDLELQKHDPSQKEKIKRLFYMINCSLLTHILKIISIVSDMIKNENNSSLKNQLLKYSKYAVLKLQYINNLIVSNEINKTNILYKEIEELRQERNEIIEKFHNMERYMIANQLDIMNECESTNSNRVNTYTDNDSENSFTSENREDISHLTNDNNVNDNIVDSYYNVK
jgi:hypothetical protein